MITDRRLANRFELCLRLDHENTELGIGERMFLFDMRKRFDILVVLAVLEK